MARCTTPTCVLTLPLRLEKWQEDRLAKRFEIARKIYNTFLGVKLKELRRLEQTPEYRAIKKELAALYSEKEKNADRIRALYEERNALLKNIFLEMASAFILSVPEKFIPCAAFLLQTQGAVVPKLYIAATILSGTNCVFH